MSLMTGTGDCGNHDLDRLLNPLVFPDSDDCPPLRLECSVDLAIARHVCGQLGVPPVVIGSRASSVLRTRVPEASVNKNGDPGSGEDDVDGAAPLPGYWIVHPIAQAAPIQGLA